MISLLIYLVMSLSSIDNQNDPLSDVRWENRVILLYGSQKSNSLYQSQINLLLESGKELNERDLIIFSIFPNSAIAHHRDLSAGWGNRIRNRYFDEEEGFRILSAYVVANGRFYPHSLFNYCLLFFSVHAWETSCWT